MVKLIKNIGMFLCCFNVFLIIFLFIKGSWFVVELMIMLKFFKCLGICDNVNILVFKFFVRVFVFVIVWLVIVK